MNDEVFIATTGNRLARAAKDESGAWPVELLQADRGMASCARMTG